jgi:CelD/BcsL family acetyltransferase involved in cellulose biosynthesis
MLRTLYITSPAELRANAAAWDDLWWRSDVTLPQARAELVAQWVERFARPATLHAVVVESDGRWVAALPLVERRLAAVLRAGVLPSGAWSAGGDLLWDASLVSDEPIADAILSGLQDVPWRLLSFEGPVRRSAWQILARTLRRRGIACDYRSRWHVGRIAIDHDWEQCRAGWSRKHRQQVASNLRRLAAKGEVHLRLLSNLPREEVEPWLRRGFEIEDRSWKGKQHTSVLSTPGVFDFFLGQARQLADWGQLELSFLECGGQPMAFAYAATAKGVMHSCKIGYDPQYADCSPGQLLRYLLLERFHGDPDRLAIDCMGPLTEAHRHWRPSTYAVGRLMVAPRGWLGKAIIGTYRWWQGQTPDDDAGQSGESSRESGLPAGVSI